MSRSPRGSKRKAAQNPIPLRQAVIAVVAGLALAVIAGGYSFALLAQRTSPGLAHALYGGLPRASARMGDALLTPDGFTYRPGAAAKVQALGAEALGATPLSSEGLRLMAISEPDKAKRRRLFEEARQVTRRDPVAAIQLAILDLENERVDAALAGFDRALRVSPDAGVLIYPVLMGASTRPQLLVRIRSLLAADPVWAERLVSWSTDNPAMLAPLSRMVGALPRGAVALAPGYGQNIIGQLAEQGRLAEAFATYAAYSRPAAFSDLARTTFAPIDWLLVDDYETGARTINKGFEIFAAANKSGTAARRLLALTPGRHTWQVRIDSVEGSGGQLDLIVLCQIGSKIRPLAQQKAPLASGQRSLSFGVPADCPFQTVQINVDGGEAPASGVISAMAMSGGAGAATR